MFGAISSDFGDETACIRLEELMLVVQAPVIRVDAIGTEVKRAFVTNSTSKPVIDMAVAYITKNPLFVGGVVFAGDGHV